MQPLTCCNPYLVLFFLGDIRTCADCRHLKPLKGALECTWSTSRWITSTICRLAWQSFCEKQCPDFFEQVGGAYLHLRESLLVYL